MRPNPRISCLRAALFLRSIGIAAAASERPAMIAPVEPRSRDAHLPSAGCMVCMAASWSCAACRSKGSMWSPSRPRIRTAPARRSPSKPDDTPEGQTLDEFFVGHHPIVGRRQQTIDPLQPERSMERDGLAGRPHRHRRGTSLKLGGANLGFARQRDFSASSRAHPHRAPRAICSLAICALIGDASASFDARDRADYIGERRLRRSPRSKNGDDDLRGGQNRSPSPSPHGRTRMIVFPGRRSVGLKAVTASSRGETVPMFVRSRPSRTRWTISPSWVRSDSTTKSTARPSTGRASDAVRRWTPAFLRLEPGARTASRYRRR